MLKKIRIKSICYLIIWRRGRDSNPRYPCEYAAFRVRCFQPLSHLSEAASPTVMALKTQAILIDVVAPLIEVPGLSPAPGQACARAALAPTKSKNMGAAECLHQHCHSQYTRQDF